MSSRRSRFSLSLVRKSDSPNSPIGDRSRSSTSENNFSTDSSCNTPLNARKRNGSLKCGSPVPYECVYSPIQMSQDASNLVSGVSWAWNSPKRVIANNYRHRPKPLSNSNRISYKEPESSLTFQKRASDKLSGFNRFQSELKLLQERHEPFNDPLEVKKTMSCSSMQVAPPTSPQPSPDGDSLFLTNNANNTSTMEHKRESLIARGSEASDSFNNSDFDNLLLQASQAVERDESTIDKYDINKPLSSSSTQIVLLTSSHPHLQPPLKHKNTSKTTSSKTKRRESFILKPRLGPDQSDSFNNSNIDNLLLQASQAVEKQVNATVILPERSNLTPVPAQEQQPEKRKNFFKSRTTDNFGSNSDDSFPESELELLLQHVVLPETTKINNQSTPGNTDPENPSAGSFRYHSLLMRHKSMPESPSHKMVNSRTSQSSNAKWNTKTRAQSPISISSSSNGSVMLLPNANDVVDIALSSKGTTFETSRTTALARKCSKEEIEQKRQEALKRQASRLKRLMQGNHSQSEATLFKS